MLIGASILMIPIGLKIGKKLKGGPKVMAELATTPDSAGQSVAVLIEAQLKAVPNARLYFTVEREGLPWIERRSFADANVMDTPPEFTLYRSEQVLALSTKHYPEFVLWMCDLDAGYVWPDGGVYVGSEPATPEADRFVGPELVSANLEQAEAMLQSLIDAGVAPEDVSMLETGYLPKVNERLADEIDENVNEDVADDGVEAETPATE